MGAALEDIWQKSLNSCDLQYEKHREFVLEGIDSNKKVWSSLVFKDESGGTQDESFYKVPLGPITPKSNGTGSTQDNVIVPLLPMVYTDASNDKFEAIQARPGYIYIFMNGYLWREVQVVERSYMRDVNLSKYQNMSYREAFGERDTRLAVPHKIDGKKQKIEICYSEVQWSWPYINSMGGMNPEDPRFKSGTRKPTGKQKGEAAARRSKRMQELNNLGDYINGFASSPDQSDVINITKTKKSIHKKINMPSNLGAVFLYDPLGVATNLKSKHIEKAYEMEILAESMTSLDYPLAKTISLLLEGENKSIRQNNKPNSKLKKVLKNTKIARGIANSLDPGMGADNRDRMIKEILTLSDEASDKDFKNIILKHVNNKSLVRVQHYVNGRRGNFLIPMTPKEVDRGIEKFIDTYRKEIYAQSPIKNVINVDRVKNSKKDWEEHSDKVNNQAIAAGKKLVKYLENTNKSVNFESVIVDYFENTSVRFANGMSLACYFIEYMENFKEGILYLESVTKNNNVIGKYLCDPIRLKPHKKMLTALENEEIKNIKLVDDGFTITSDLVSNLTQRSLNTVSKLLEGLAKTKIAEGEKGLKWLADWLKSCLEEDAFKNLSLAIEEESINKLYRPQKEFKKHIYKYLPDATELFEKNKVKYLSIENSKPNEIFDSFNNNKVYKSSFLVLNGVLQIINLANAYNKILSIKTKSAKDKVVIAGALIGVMEFGTQVVEMLLSAKEGYLNSSIEESNKKKAKMNQKADTALRKKTDRKRVRQAKYKAAKSRAKLFENASKTAMRSASSISQWTRVASVSSRVLGVVGGVLFYVEMVLELRDQKNLGGYLGVGMKTAGGTMAIFASYKAVRWIVTTVRTTAVGITLMGAGAATAELGVGIVIFIIGVILTILGETLLKEFNRPQLMKALDYCYFGQHPYGEGKWITDNPYRRDKRIANYYSKEAIERRENARPYTYESSWTNWPIVILYDIDFNAEVQEIYNALFSFNVSLDIAKIVDSNTKKATGEYVVRCNVNFGQFLETKSEFNCNLHFIQNYTKSGTKQVHFPELKKKEIVDKNGELTQLKIFYKVTKKEATELVRMEMYLRLDIHGDQKNQVPKKKDYYMRYIPRYTYRKQLPQGYELTGAITIDNDDNRVSINEVPLQSSHEVDEAYKS